MGEDVEGQGLLPLVDELDGLIHAAHGDDGQHRPKDLLLHHLGLHLHVPQDGGSWAARHRRS